MSRWLTLTVASCDMDALLLLVLDPVVALLIGIIKWLVLYPITFVLVTPCIFIHAVFARDGFRETVSSDFEWYLAFWRPKVRSQSRHSRFGNVQFRWGDSEATKPVEPTGTRTAHD